MNASVPQMISLTSGRIGFGAFWVLSAASSKNGCTADSSGELQQDEHDEADEREGFGEGDAEEHGGAHHAGGLGLAGHRRDGVADHDADAEARTEGGGAAADPGTDGTEALQDLFVRDRDVCRCGKQG